MRGTIEDMRSAYAFFDKTLFDGMLLPLSGERRVELCIEGMSNNAECSYQDYGFKIAFDANEFGGDIERDLVSLFHEQMHTHVGWDGILTMHKGAWLAGMAFNGIEVADNGALIRVVPGGLFDQRRAEWLRLRNYGAAHVYPGQTSAAEAGASGPGEISGTDAALILVVATAASIMLGLFIQGNSATERGYARHGQGYNSEYYSRGEE